MVNITNQSIADVDLTILVVEPIPSVGAQEQTLIEQLRAKKCPVVLAINKIDTVEKDILLSLTRYMLPLAPVQPLMRFITAGQR